MSSICKPTDLSRSLIPLMKEEWTQSVSADEELYQEHWGEYEAWWYNPFHQDVGGWWYSLHKIPNFANDGDELVRKENGVWCILPYYWQNGLLQGVDLPGGGMKFEEKKEPDDADKRRYIEESIFACADVCIACGRVFDSYGHFCGMVALETLSIQQTLIKCKHCGPPAPSGETNPEIIHCRWPDYEKVHMDSAGGTLMIVHATYGGPSCPHRDVTAKLRRAVDFQRQNLSRDGEFIAEKGIHEWIGDPEEGVAKVLRVWYKLKTPKERRAIETLARFAIKWREDFYRPGGRFEAIASKRFNKTTSSKE